MNRTFSAAQTLIVTSVIGTLALIACDPPIDDTDTVRNDLVATSTIDGVAPVPVGITSIQIRFRGEEDEDVSPIENGNFDPIAEAIPAGTVSGSCTEDADCDGGTCVTDFCFFPVDTPVTPFECGIYDVMITGDNGQTCSIIANEGNRDNREDCTTTSDCDDSFSCVDGSCEYRYGGDASFICFGLARWDLSVHINTSNCPELFPTL